MTERVGAKNDWGLARLCGRYPPALAIIGAYTRRWTPTFVMLQVSLLRTALRRSLRSRSERQGRRNQVGDPAALGADFAMFHTFRDLRRDLRLLGLLPPGDRSLFEATVTFSRRACRSDAPQKLSPSPRERIRTTHRRRRPPVSLRREPGVLRIFEHSCERLISGERRSRSRT